MSNFLVVHGFIVLIVINIIAIVVVHRYFKHRVVRFHLEDQELDIELRRWVSFSQELLEISIEARRLEASKKLNKEMLEKYNWKKEGF